MIFLLKGLVGFNTIILKLGRQLAWIAIGLMVVIILIQVYFRYVLNSALPWPDEAARFLMLWMTGFIAPSAYRWGGFVSIEMLFRMLPSRIIKIVTLMLLMMVSQNGQMQSGMMQCGSQPKKWKMMKQ